MSFYKKTKEFHLYNNTRDYIYKHKRYRIKKIKMGWYTLFIFCKNKYHPIVSSQEVSYKNLLVRYLNNNFNNGYYIGKVWVKTKLPVNI